MDLKQRLVVVSPNYGVQPCPGVCVTIWVGEEPPQAGRLVMHSCTSACGVAWRVVDDGSIQP